MSALLSTDIKIKQLCLTTGEPGFHNYSRLQGHMLSAIMDLNIYSLPCWSVKVLPITLINTVNWPCDCIKPLITTLRRKVGNKYCHFLLEISEDLMDTLIPNYVPSTTPDESLCTAKDFFQIDGFIEAYGWGVWSWGLGELYGQNTLLPPAGVVVPDKKNRQSYIKKCRIETGDDIVMFFKSSGLSECPEYIPSEAEQVVEYFILMKWYETRNPNLADDMERKYKERLFRLDSFNSDTGESEWTRAMGSNTKSSPKF